MFCGGNANGMPRSKPPGRVHSWQFVAELPELFAEALNAEASVYLSRGDFDAAKPLLEQILSVAEDHRILGVALQNLGSIAAMAKEFDKAKRCFLASREHFVRAGYRRGEALALNNGAAIMNDLGEHASALAMAEEAAEAARDVGDFELRALASLNRAQALLAMERYSEAEDLGEPGARLLRRRGRSVSSDRVSASAGRHQPQTGPCGPCDPLLRAGDQAGRDRRCPGRALADRGASRGDRGTTAA